MRASGTRACSRMSRRAKVKAEHLHLRMTSWDVGRGGVLRRVRDQRSLHPNADRRSSSPLENIRRGRDRGLPPHAHAERQRAAVRLVRVELRQLRRELGNSCDPLSSIASSPRAWPLTRLRQPRPGEQADASLDEAQHAVTHESSAPPWRRAVTKGLPSRSAPIHDPKRSRGAPSNDSPGRTRDGPPRVSVDARHGLGERRGEVNEAASNSSSTVSEMARNSSEPHSSCTVASSCLRPVFTSRPVIHLTQHAKQPRELVDRRAPARLRWMRGHHEAQLGANEAGLQVGGARPSSSEIRDGFANRP